MSYGTIWIITLLVMVLSYIVQALLNSRFDDYSRVPVTNGMTGAEVARKMLRDNGITVAELSADVVSSSSGVLTDSLQIGDNILVAYAAGKWMVTGA